MSCATVYFCQSKIVLCLQSPADNRTEKVGTLKPTLCPLAQHLRTWVFLDSKKESVRCGQKLLQRPCCSYCTSTAGISTVIGLLIDPLISNLEQEICQCQTLNSLSSKLVLSPQSTLHFSYYSDTAEWFLKRKVYQNFSLYCTQSTNT